MFKKIILLSGVSVLLLSLAWCSLFNKNDSTNVPSKDVSYYDGVWKDSFRYNQTTTTNLPTKWKFDFEVAASIQWDSQKLKEVFKDYWTSNLNWDFNNLTIRVLWDYDFSTGKNDINISLKLFFNKINYWIWDIDISAEIKSDYTIDYYINNLDRNFLTFFWIDTSTIDTLIAIYTENKNKKMTYQLPAILVEQIKATLAESKDGPLKNNTQDQEKQIIDSFLNNNVIEVLSWESAESVDRVNFKFNTTNFIKFMNEVAKINNYDSNFDWESESLKNLLIKWNLDISNKLIIDSRILTEFMLKWINKETNKEQYDQITLDSKLKLLDPKIVNFDFSTALASAKSPDNKLIIRIRWMIK